MILDLKSEIGIDKRRDKSVAQFFAFFTSFDIVIRAIGLTNDAGSCKQNLDFPGYPLCRSRRQGHLTCYGFVTYTLDITIIFTSLIRRTIKYFQDKIPDLFYHLRVFTGRKW